MRRARWVLKPQDFPGEFSRKPAIYHCISRVVERRFAFGAEEKEHFRMLMRMMEKFSGCRVLSYCLMCNHIHLLIEVPPLPEGGISDEVFLMRLSALYGENFVAGVASEIETARSEGELDGGIGHEARVEEIKARFTYRMHDLGEFMKTVMQRFTQWFNGQHKRTGTLWEDRFKSVIVESGTAARTMAAYIDLNPVRAGMVSDPAEYRWSSYGEAVGGGKKGNGKKAREGLMRAYFSEQPECPNHDKWREVSRLYRRLMGMAIERKSGRSGLSRAKNSKGNQSGQSQLNTAEMLASKDNGTILKDLGMAKLLRCRVRYFTDGAVIGSREFVNETFKSARERFGPKRKSGARTMRGTGAATKGVLWSLRDLRVRD
jgi:putative transposase